MQYAHLYYHSSNLSWVQKSDSEGPNEAGSLAIDADTSLRVTYNLRSLQRGCAGLRAGQEAEGPPERVRSLRSVYDERDKKVDNQPVAAHQQLSGVKILQPVSRDHDTQRLEA